MGKQAEEAAGFLFFEKSALPASRFLLEGLVIELFQLFAYGTVQFPQREELLVPQ